MKTTETAGPDTYVAFLRGINVGGNNTVSMARLRTCFQELGFGDVQTLGVSGNVVFRTAPANPRELESAIENALATDLALPVRVVVRSFEEMKRVVEAIPADWEDGRDPIHDVIFLRHTIDSPKLVNDLQPKPGIEELQYSPGVLFWSVKRRDFSRSSLSKIVGTKPYKEMTVRSPGTTRKVYDLMATLKGAARQER